MHSRVFAQAAVLREVGLPKPYALSKPLHIQKVFLRGPGPSNVLVQIKAASLCHSDLSVINGSRPRPMPMVIGHEASGIVLETGSSVDQNRVKPGDHVVMTFNPACGHCVPCASGRPAQCSAGAVANGAGTLVDGSTRISDPNGPIHHHLGTSAFATHAIVSPNSLVKIPKSLPFEQAALFGCAVLTGAGAVLNTAKARVGDTLAVVGLGGVGLAAVLGARAAGAAKIVAVDVSNDKLDLAMKIGATHAVNAKSDAVNVVKKITNGGADHVIETAGVIAALESAVAMTRPGGSTTTAGLPPAGAKLGVDIAQLVGQERQLLGSYMGSAVPARDIPRLISLFQQGRLPVDQLLTSTISLKDINAAFDDLDQGKAVRQVVVF